MTKKRAAAYVRVSNSEYEQGLSLDGQARQIREFAGQNGYTVAYLYSDMVAGNNERRPGLEQLLSAARDGLFETVILLDASRLFRSPDLTQRYHDLLSLKFGLDVIFVHSAEGTEEDAA